MKIIYIATLLTFLCTGCWLVDVADHVNPYDPATANKNPVPVLFDYKGIKEVRASEITINWIPNADMDFDHYVVFRSRSRTFDENNSIATVKNQNNTTFEDADLSPGTLYYYTIRTFDKGGLYSDSETVRCLSAPDIENEGYSIFVWTSGFYTGQQYLFDVKVADYPADDPDYRSDLIFVSGRGRDDSLASTSDGYFIRAISSSSVLSTNGIASMTGDYNILLDRYAWPANSPGFSFDVLYDDTIGANGDYRLYYTDYYDGSIYSSDGVSTNDFVYLTYNRIDAVNTDYDGYYDIDDALDNNWYGVADPVCTDPVNCAPSGYDPSFLYVTTYFNYLFALEANGNIFLYDADVPEWDFGGELLANIFDATYNDSTQEIGIDLPIGMTSYAYYTGTDWKYNLYFTGWASHKVAKTTDDDWNNPSWVVGGSGSENLEFSNPTGIAVDEETGYVYVSDTGNNRVQVLDDNGNFIGKWGTYGTGINEFVAPRGMDFMTTDDGSKFLLIAEETSVKMYKIK